DFPLTLHSMLERANTQYGQTEIATRVVAGDSDSTERGADFSMHRYTYRDFYRRARSLAEALKRAGLQPADRVATLMWNTYQHLECYFGIPAAGGVTHTLNLRLHADELAYIMCHADDRLLIVD